MKTLALSLFVLFGLRLVAMAQTPVRLPATFWNNRIYLHVAGKDKNPIVFYTDTGGGLFVRASSLAATGYTSKQDSAGNYAPVAWAALVQNSRLPRSLHQQLAEVWVLDDKKEQMPIDFFDGMLGQQFFAGQCWQFDYLKKEFWVGVGTPEKVQSIPLNLKEGIAFARIQVSVDGELLDLLFDTGATCTLTMQAQQQLADGLGPFRATSFIVADYFDKWRSKHPDWRVIEQAEEMRGNAYAMIEVPQVTIAGHKVGPVWFAYRPNKNFYEYMSQWTDQRVVGAIGGSALQYFRVTADYKNKKIWFER